MSLSDFAKAGAQSLIDAVNAMNGINNAYRPKYDEVLGQVRTALNDQTLTLSGLTDAQVNTVFLSGLGDAVSVASAKNVLSHWEALINDLGAAVVSLPANNL